MIHENTPILVGYGMCVQKERDPIKAKAPIELLAEAAQLALDDAAFDKSAIDTLGSIRFITDSPEARQLPYGKYSNPAQSVAGILGLAPSQTLLAATGGNSPQMMINEMAERITKGDIGVGLLVGGEGFGSLMRAIGQGLKVSQLSGLWNDDPPESPEQIGQEKEGVLPVEHRHGLFFPVNYYPLFENALRAHLGRTMDEHMKAVGDLMAPFTQIAATHPQAWFPTARTSEELVQESDENRWVGYPYPKYLNAVMRIDQAAAIVMMSVGKARALGIPENQWVYLHGCADVNEIWNGAARPDLHRSYAINKMTKRALAMAGWHTDDIDYFDLYSCFPVAVEVACREMGLAEDDTRPFTVTGGLPYFGGAGNAYALLSVATMMQKLRAKPNSKGLCTANGWFLTKHSIGVYSTTPFEGEWQREPIAQLQSEIDAMPRLKVAEAPIGAGTIETYTVAHPAGKDRQGILIGRMHESGERFVAYMNPEGDNVARLMEEDGIGLVGDLSQGEGGVNYFTPKA
ncbi:MAG: acetyl-CoA acetyltransferase [Alphaproteobacteria bacterium]|nr:acetyl-CoA acetyltransferase [Alphaproteobacteria bacterium]